MISLTELTIGHIEFCLFSKQRVHIYIADDSSQCSWVSFSVKQWHHSHQNKDTFILDIIGL